MSTQPSDLEGLSMLGSNAQPSKDLEVFPNHTQNRFYLVTIESNEFTNICPATGQPDFATVKVEYVPDEKIVESKSFKLYLWSYRNEGVFHEHVTNVILDDLVKALDPHYCKVTMVFNVRGGLYFTVEAEHVKTPDAKSAVKN